MAKPAPVHQGDLVARLTTELEKRVGMSPAHRSHYANLLRLLKAGPPVRWIPVRLLRAVGADCPWPPTYYVTVEADGSLTPCPPLDD